MVDNGFSSPPNNTFPAGLRVLVVDDDPTFLTILEKMLKRCSYEVTTCMSAVHALRLLRPRKDGYDIILSDVKMPDMDGFKLLEIINLEMHIPVILVSADVRSSQVMKGIRLGACDYLVKPVRIKELKNIWQHSMRNYKVQKDIEVLEGTGSIGITREESNQYDSGDLIFGEVTSFKKGLDAENKHNISSIEARAVWSYPHQQFDCLPSSSRNSIIGIPSGCSGNMELKCASNGTQHSSPNVGNSSWFKTQHKYISNGSYGVFGKHRGHESDKENHSWFETEHKYISNGNNGVSGKHRGHESDGEETVSMPRKRTLAVVSGSSNSKSSQYEYFSPASSTSSGSSEEKFAAFDSTFLFQLPRDDEKNHNSRNE